MKSLLGILALSVSSYGLSATNHTKQKTCNLGFGKHCLIAGQVDSLSATPWRVEGFSGYKGGMSYYEKEKENCELSQGCRFSPEGQVYGVDVYFNRVGNNYGDDFLDLGFQYATIPVASIESAQSLEGEDDSLIGAGKGELRYHFIRMNVKRGNFLYLLKSKYLISSFGVGIGIPDADGTGDGFAGGRSIVPSIGGKLGFQFPLLTNLDVGIATNWSVLWYGKQMSDSAFLAGYGVNLSYRLN